MEDVKGQSAIEYLTTYGWMLLVIAVIGGAIFTTVQNSSQIQSVSGLSNSDVQVSDYGLSDDGLQLSLRAASRDQVDIQKVEITDPETGVSADISPSKVVPVGDTAQVNLQDVQTTDTSGTYDMDIVYDTGGLQGLTVEGTITGSFGVFNRIAMMDAEFNRSTNELQIGVKNAGDNTTNSIDYTVEANDTDYTGSLPNLEAGEETQINITTDETYLIKSVNLDAEGKKFVDSNPGLKCTPTQGLLGYWTFNNEKTDETNKETLDLSKYDNNGALINGTKTGVSGKVGEAFKFNYEDETAVKVGDKKIYDNMSKLTVSVWVRHNNVTENYHQQYVGKVGESYDDAFGLWYRRDPGNFEFLVDDKENESNERVSINVTPKENRWYHIVGSYNGSASKIYLNGELENKTHTPDGELISTQNPVIIGNFADLYTRGMRGRIDEVRIYNRSLSKSEIKRLYQVRSKDWAVSGCKLTG